MASRALTPVPAFAPFVELLARQRTLARFGGGLLILAAVTLMLQAIDPRVLASGINVWVKPTKFLFSVGVFALTAAWFFGYVRPERRASWPMRVTVAVLVLTATFELVWIAWQGANGLESHFNNDTVFYDVMFSLMGLFALLLTGTALPLAWEIARRPAPGVPRDFAAAVVAGLVLTFLLGVGFGTAIAMNGAHSVGAEGGAVPIFGWNRSGGDLRIAHFLGIHAEQAIPLLALLLGGLGAAKRRTLLVAGTAAYAAVAFAVYLQAAAGRPLLPL
jgi:hypothetical protein